MWQRVTKRGLGIGLGVAAVLAVIARLRKQQQQRAARRASEVAELTKGGTRVFRIVLTGGPCGGKTTALAEIISALELQGVRVLTVPESATIMFTNGATFHDLENSEDQADFQYRLMALQMYLEDQMTWYARMRGGTTVIICDRGVCDTKAYVPPHTWRRILEKYHLNPLTLRDERYDAVLHMVTAADGAEKFYTLSNNTARRETIEQARTIDSALKAAWRGHRFLRVIGNNGEFSDKLAAVVAAAKSAVGMAPGVLEFRRFLLMDVPRAWPIEAEEALSMKVFLKAKQRIDEGFSALYQSVYVTRIQKGSHTSYRLISESVIDKQHITRQKIITPSDFRELVDFMRDSKFQPVVQNLYRLLYRDRPIEIQQYIRPAAGVCTVALHVEPGLSEEEVKKHIPPFLRVGREVTHDEQYSSRSLSKRVQQ